MDMNELMTTALDFEKKGFDIYTKAAKKTKNKFVKETFEYLASQEKFHVDEIKEYVKKHDIKLEGDDPKQVKEFFNTTIEKFKEQAELTQEDIEAYKLGLQLETDAAKYYKQKLEDANDDKVKYFLQFLVRQEFAHYDLLYKGYNYLKDPQNFHLENESWFFEG
jgi:rubrerythrin